ncbi:MAG: hypothetical protein HRT73_08315 [Flavobacteriales bacterium]|nr:hypothetical protein [Flavobacteriales bacterium]
MKTNFIILLIGIVFVGCGEETLKEEVVFNEDSNWQVNLDSLKTVDNYILAHRSFKKTGVEYVVPYIVTSDNKKISMSQINPMTGKGCVWDCRTAILITISDDESYFVRWNSGSSCRMDDVINYEKNIDSKEELIIEIQKFFTTNYALDYFHPAQEESTNLEVWVTQRNDNLNYCESVIVSSASAFQSFIKLSIFKEIPFLIKINPKLDKNRIRRIVAKENLLRSNE